ncbi:MAG: TIM barrel protein [Opitutales bacterium]|nr:TIM barrel protein [Opitutales bacterium]
MADKPVIALSTSYFRQKYSDGYEMLCKCAELGFEHVELGHNTTMNLVEGVLKAAKEGVVKISSLHNFCPVPPFALPPAPNLYSPATSSKAESAQWRRHTLNTLSFAEQVGAGRVVAHAGALSYFFINPKYALLRGYDRTLAFRAMSEPIGEGGGGASEKSRAAAREKFEKQRGRYLKRLEKFIAKAEKKSAKFHERIFENLRGVDGGFQKAGVLLGVENRDGYCELPFDTKFAEFTRGCAEKLSSVRPWIDIGHVMVKARRGVLDFCEFVETASRGACGWHLHDCDDSARDHLAIGKGAIDFGFVKKFFDKSSQIFTLELNGRVSEADVVDSRKRAEDMF